MGKKQVRQVRQQMRRIQPKAAAASNTQGATRKQRERYVQSGGMLQGYAPERVIRIGYVSIGVAVLCAAIMAAWLVFIPPIYGWPVAVAQKKRAEARAGAPRRCELGQHLDGSRNAHGADARGS